MATFTISNEEMEEEDLTLQQLKYEYQLSEGELAQIANLAPGGKASFEDGFVVERTS